MENQMPEQLIEGLVWICCESLAYAGAYKCYLTLGKVFMLNNIFIWHGKLNFKNMLCVYPNMHNGNESCVDCVGPLPLA